MTDAPAARIIHAALGLIVEHGIGGVTMSAVARQAGVARQTLYNHYPDIESIVYAAVDAHQRESLDQLSELIRTVDSPSGRLEHLVRHTAAVAAHSHPNFKHGFSSKHQELLAQYDRGFRTLVEAALRDGVKTREFRADIDPRPDAVLLQRMIEGAGELVSNDPDNGAATVTTAVKTVLAAVRT